MNSGALARPPCMGYLRGVVGSFDRIDPSLGTVASQAPACKASDAVNAANAAARAFAAWSQRAPIERRAILMRAAALARAQASQIEALMMAEIGATAAWVAVNIRMACEHLEEAASLATQVEGRVSQDMTSFAFREPVGVCLAIAPWNAPFILAMRAIALPLACGNTVVLKASENSPTTHMFIGKLLTEAGLPEGVLNIITHAPEDAGEIVEALIAHQAVRRVNFTGSTRVGRMIAEISARNLKRCLLELGGKAPLLVLEDADIDAAADAAAYGSFLNQGQICMSTDRIIVVEPVADRFASALTDRARPLRAGDPRKGDWPLGPVISTQVARRLADLVADAVDRGAKLLCGGTAGGNFFDATVVDHIQPGMGLYGEECFGPIATICRVQSEDEAIAVANDTDYGLSAAIFSRDTGRALRLARQIESGICHINGPTVQDRADMPFGGVKDSGHGRFGGPSAIDEFTELRWVTLGGGSANHGINHEAPEGAKREERQ